MQTNETHLQAIARQCAEKITRATVEAIEDGTKIERTFGGVSVDGLFIVKGDKKYGTRHAVVLRLDAPEIDALFEPTADQLQERAQKLREELQQIENQLNTPEQ